MHTLGTAIIIFTLFLASFVSTFGSSIVVGDETTIAAHFRVSSDSTSSLVATYLFGCALAPLVFSPLSERHGRRFAIWGGTGIMAIFNMASAAAPNWAALLAFRFFAGFGSSAAMVVPSGIIADILPNVHLRGLASSWMMVNTTLGSVFGSIVSTAVHARWPGLWNVAYWINGGASVLAFALLLALPETRKKTIGEKHESPIKLSRVEQLILPIRMLLLEPMVTFCCLFLSTIYGIYYLLFQLLPPAFTTVYGWEGKTNDVTFVPLAVGTVLAGIVFTASSPALCRWAEGEGRARWAPENRRLPLACIGAGFIILALFVLGYAVREGTSSSLALVAEGAFGLGFLLVFMSLTNYLVDAYKVRSPASKSS
ncbi:MFS general substrate transporter [Lecanosticta acicola]|uniref:MFS general substrate transporter n=1 Tax=Lecanosticta acicola TaxID=111012 RepID=A0AAI8W187_9PEZI|nr:MFS general substrate transporter [Lecanosticta acicola]